MRAGRSVAVAVAAAALAALLLVANASAARPARCPTQTVRPAGGSLEGLVHALRRQIPSAIHLTNQAGAVVLTPRTYTIAALVSLDPSLSGSVPSATARRYRRVAARLCGSRVADDSWVARLSIPEAQTVLDGSPVVYVARTPAGWRLWYHAP